jgi:hypothetical protein
MMDSAVLGKKFGRVLLTPKFDELTFVNLDVDMEKLVGRVEGENRVGRRMRQDGHDEFGWEIRKRIE